MKGHALSIIQAIESGATGTKAIAEVTMIPVTSVRARLTDLQKLGAVRSYFLQKTNRRRGGLYKHYRIVKGESK